MDERVGVAGEGSGGETKTRQSCGAVPKATLSPAHEPRSQAQRTIVRAPTPSGQQTNVPTSVMPLDESTMLMFFSW